MSFEFGTAPARTREGGPRKRSEAQLEIDALVEQLVEAWEQAGSPSKSSEKPCVFVPVENEDDVKEYKKKFNSAATLLGVSARFYDVQNPEPGVYKLPVSAESKREYRPRKKTADAGE
jgi:hypothetical protein